MTKTKTPKHKKESLNFLAQIPDTRRAFEIPGSRSEARITLVLGEDQVPKALPIILWRGIILSASIQRLTYVDKSDTYKKVGEPVQLYVAVTSRDSAIKINGVDGMSIQLSFPSLNEQSLVDLLKFREHMLDITLTHEVK